MNGDPAQFFSQLGVSAVTVAILAYAVKQLWQDNKDLRSQSREDQKAVLPALIQATEAMKSMVEVAARLASRNPRGE